MTTIVAQPGSSEVQVKALPERVALYARISEDDTGVGAGVARQLADARALAELRGWPVVGEWADNSISAMSGKHRPQYAALMEEVRAGGVDRIIAWQQSRLWRDRRERAEAIDLLRRHRVNVSTVRGGEHDLSTATGRGFTAIMGEVDTLESEIKGERVAAAAEERARKGKANGPCPHGWRREREINAAGKVVEFRDVEDPDTADVVRRITRDLLSGKSLLEVTRALNAEAVPAPGATFTFTGKKRAVDNPDGSRWSKTSVKKLALRPGNAGLRIYHRGRPDERLLPAEWPALVDEQQWREVVQLLAAEGRDQRVRRPANRQHLLTWGVGACECGAHLRVAGKGPKGKPKVPYYVCTGPGCGLGRREAQLDKFVGDVVVGRLSKPDALAWLAPNSGDLADATRRAAEAEELLATAGVKLATGEWAVATVDAVTAATRPKLEQAQARIRRLKTASDLSVLTEIAGPQARQRWDAAPLGRRRMILEALGLRVVIKRATKRGPGFDPDAVEVIWP